MGWTIFLDITAIFIGVRWEREVIAHYQGFFKDGDYFSSSPRLKKYDLWICVVPCVVIHFWFHKSYTRKPAGPFESQEEYQKFKKGS